MEDYVHRAGRTGRAGNKGTCVSFITPEQERYSVDIYRALKASNVAIPKDLEELANGEQTTILITRLIYNSSQASWIKSKRARLK